MRDFRLVMLSTEPRSDYWFVVYSKAKNAAEANYEANLRYGPQFEVDKHKTTEIAG